MLPEVQRCAPKINGRKEQRAADAQTGGGGASLAFLHEAIRSIGTTLDLERTVRELTDLVVPGFADFASVHLYDQVTAEEDSSLPAPKGSVVMRRAAVSHQDDPRSWENFRAGTAFVYGADTPMALFLATNEPVLIPRVDKDILRDLPEQLDSAAARLLLLDASLLLVPLAARGSVLGFMAFVRGAGRPPFDTTDLTVSQELAERAALCVDNARLYTRETRAVAALQGSMLPTRPPRLPGVEIAYRYHPGSDNAQVGGDWFDAIPLPGGRVALVVGDVVGHGLRAAAAMSQLRTAVQTLAGLDLPPAQLLTHLDHLAQRLGHTHLATCLYCVYDPIAQHCTFANAGHLPPILLRPDGSSELLDVPTGVPIGVGGVDFGTLELPVDAGSLLVLCTDGLVETREQDIEEGLATLLRNLTAVAGPLEEACETLLRQQHPDGPHDDIALLMARLDGIDENLPS